MVGSPLARPTAGPRVLHAPPISRLGPDLSGCLPLRRGGCSVSAQVLLWSLGRPTRSWLLGCVSSQEVLLLLWPAAIHWHLPQQVLRHFFSLIKSFKWENKFGFFGRSVVSLKGGVTRTRCRAVVKSPGIFLGVMRAHVCLHFRNTLIILKCFVAIEVIDLRGLQGHLISSSARVLCHC